MKKDQAPWAGLERAGDHVDQGDDGDETVAFSSGTHWTVLSASWP